MKKILIAAILASACVGAMAETVNAGAIPVSPAAPYSYTFVHDYGSFFDTVNFSVTESDLSASVSALNLSLGKFSVLGVTELYYQLWDGSHPNGAISYGSFGGDNVTHLFDLTAPGNYHIDITGFANGSAGGIYSVALQTAAVPEPETYAMLLGGLGLLGVTARRKRKQK